ncbi:hypothetical protein A6J64_014260 [Yersinia enterocolitica]|nr:hypothetical protein A6J64_014260 [Yersinia enterocolitica]
MTKYYVNSKKQDNGDNEVHTAECRFLPSSDNRVYLGEFSSCSPAVTAAKDKGYHANGCIHCCKPCHTS